MPTLALLRDSILDNDAYVGGAPSTTQHVGALLGPQWEVHKLAIDGAVIGETRSQFSRLPDPCDCAVLSAGGNDALRHLDLLFSGPFEVALHRRYLRTSRS